MSGRSLFQTPPEASRLYARVPGVALSVVLHVTCLLGVVAITRSAVERTPRPKTSLTFAPVSLAVPRNALTARPEPPRLAVRKIEPLPKPPRAPAPADESIRKVEAPAPVTPPPPVQAEVQEPPNTIPIVPKAEPVVRVGAFEAVAPSRSRPRETAAVVAAGFGDASARGTARALPTAVVASGGFDREVAPPPPVAPSVAPVAAFGDSTPIEILFKPKPRYTDEAETLGIQGTVVLEVEFTASNEVRVLRVIRKLGHGLDEAAVRAAEQIRFKPARRQGVAVDSRVTVQIEFHLS
ncbi:MAG TPA: TonB family protein [Vicinamibacterales bacterium]|nr:TonB family protein [Vicinamibacterales bacterium]